MHAFQTPAYGDAAGVAHHLQHVGFGDGNVQLHRPFEPAPGHALAEAFQPVPLHREQFVEDVHGVQFISFHQVVELGEEVVQAPLTVDPPQRVVAEGAAIGTRPAGDHRQRPGALEHAQRLAVENPLGGQFLLYLQQPIVGPRQ